jgi:PAS domain S-box-containing protein
METPVPVLDSVPVSADQARLASRLLAMRAAFYAVTVALGVLLAVAVPSGQAVVTTALAVAALVPLVLRGRAGAGRLQWAVGLDLVGSFVLWWLFGPLAAVNLLILWCLGAAAFLMSHRHRLVVVGVATFLEVLRLPPMLAFAGGGGLLGYHAATPPYTATTAEVLVTVGVRVAAVLFIYAFFGSVRGLYARARAAQVETEGRYVGLVEMDPDGILVHRDGVIVYANERLAQIAGLETADDVVGRHLLDFVHPDDHPVFVERIRAIGSARGQVRRSDERLLRSDGSEFFADFVSLPIMYEGRPAAQVVVTDVTERHDADEALRASEARYRTLFERIPVALYRTTPAGQIVDANPALAELLGYEGPARVRGLNATGAYVRAGDREEAKRTMEADGVLRGAEAELRRADGTTIWVRDTARIVADGDGTVYFEGALENVTERRSAEDELRARASQQAAVAELGQLALRTFDVDAVFAAATAAIVDVLGVGAAAIVERSGDEFTVLAAAGKDARPPGTILSPGSVVATAMTAGSAVAEPARSPVPGSEAAVAIAGDDGPFGALVVHAAARGIVPSDVTFLRSMANVVAAAITRRKGRDRLEGLVRSKDEFVASVSHELRTPLTVVAGIAFELRDHLADLGPTEVAEYVGMIVTESGEMVDLIEDLLVAARADIGKLTVTPASVDLGREVAEVVASLSTDRERHVEVGGTDAVAWADASRVRQILRNLLTNAFRYGGRRVAVEVGGDGERAVIEVSDDGPGVPPGERELIFEPYQRAHASPGQPASVGLGLTVSRTLARLMGGDLAYDHDGRSVFRLTLPVGDAAGNGPAARARHPERVP